MNFIAIHFVRKEREKVFLKGLDSMVSGVSPIILSGIFFFLIKELKISNLRIHESREVGYVR